MSDTFTNIMTGLQIQNQLADASNKIMDNSAINFMNKIDTYAQMTSDQRTQFHNDYSAGDIMYLRSKGKISQSDFNSYIEITKDIQAKKQIEIATKSADAVFQSIDLDAPQETLTQAVSELAYNGVPFEIAINKMNEYFPNSSSHAQYAKKYAPQVVSRANNIITEAQEAYRTKMYNDKRSISKLDANINAVKDALEGNFVGIADQFMYGASYAVNPIINRLFGGNNKISSPKSVYKSMIPAKQINDLTQLLRLLQAKRNSLK